MANEDDHTRWCPPSYVCSMYPPLTVGNLWLFQTTYRLEARPHLGYVPAVSCWLDSMTVSHPGWIQHKIMQREQKRLTAGKSYRTSENPRSNAFLQMFPSSTGQTLTTTKNSELLHLFVASPRPNAFLSWTAFWQSSTAWSSSSRNAACCKSSDSWHDC